MKGIKVFILIFYMFSTNLSAQDNSNTIDISYIYDNLSKSELLKEIANSEIKINNVINEAKTSNNVSLNKKLIVIDALGELTDGYFSEQISSVVYSLFTKNAEGVIYYIYHDDLKSVKAFLFNEFCMSFTNKSNIKQDKNKIIKSIKYRYGRIKIKKEASIFKRNFIKFDCEP